MPLGPFEAHAGDLAPGDRRVLEMDWSDFAVARVASGGDPLFEPAWSRLWQEFGERGEMERRDVIRDRLDWNGRRVACGYALLYELLVVTRGGEIVAVRDHTAIVPPGVSAGDSRAGAVVHLSHVLVEPAIRGRGLAAWLRALPVDSARRCLGVAQRSLAEDRPGCAEDRHRVAADRDAPQHDRGDASRTRVVLVAEMEPDDGVAGATVRRLRSYGNAGFRLVDPRDLSYLQPDFRSADEIDRSSLKTVPLCLVVRRVGREQEEAMSGAELREILAALQAVFSVHVRADHMQAVRERVRIRDEDVHLLTPPATRAAGFGRTR